MIYYYFIVNNNNVFECRSSGPGSSTFVILRPSSAICREPCAVWPSVTDHASQLAERKTCHAPPDSVPYAIKGNDKAVSRAKQEASWLGSGIKPTWISPLDSCPPNQACLPLSSATSCDPQYPTSSSSTSTSSTRMCRQISCVSPPSSSLLC